MTDKTKRSERKVNKVSKPDVDNVGLRELDKATAERDGKYVGTQRDAQSLQKAAETRKKETKLGKNLTVRTVTGGHMHYFDADRTITGDPTVVPDSNWLQMQIAAKKIELVK